MKKVKLNEIEVERQRLKLLRWHSKFSFLMNHKGLRESCVHGLIGTTSAGKSTLVKSIIHECATQAKVAVWLSEELSRHYSMGLVELGATQSDLDNIYFIEEYSLPPSTGNMNKFHDFVESKFSTIFSNGCRIIFIDNVTTSKMYSSAAGPQGQELICEIFKHWTDKGLTIFWVGHTIKGVSNNNGRMVTPEDIRGLNFISMITEYFYCMTKITFNNTQANIIEVAKYRHHEEARGYYLLNYKDKKYTGDVKLSFDELKCIMEKRDKLGGK